MPTNILMPALSPTMEKGNLARWLKKEGDAIKSGDILAEIETDKATMEVEAVDEGTLARIVVPDGTTDVAVNDVIGIIAAEGEDANTATASPKADAKPVEKPAAPGEAPAKQDLEVPVGHQYERAPAMEHVGAGSAVSAANGHEAEGTRTFSSPLARRIAKENSLDIATIAGTGPHGRVVERDVKAALAGGGAAFT
ncbi:E3 binding domain-containing protein, partial [Lichenihabitans sp. Uapishka_5]|uniref:biotin/lipoyl-containing protein n=1 Tax=Lichenihabitans sp. Uapishka_5 TaxID=3037302 RepID=UPI0029E7F1B7